MLELELLKRIKQVERELESLRVLETPVLVAARYTTNAGQSIPNGSITVINYEDSDIDTHNAVTVGAGWIFTTPMTGLYHVNASIRFTSTTGWAETEVAQLLLYKNGSLKSSLDYAWGQDSSGGAQFKDAHGADLVYLLSDETINFRVLQTSGGSLALNTSGAYNYVAIERVG